MYRIEEILTPKGNSKKGKCSHCKEYGPLFLTENHVGCVKKWSKKLCWNCHIPYADAHEQALKLGFQMVLLRRNQPDLNEMPW